MCVTTEEFIWSTSYAEHFTLHGKKVEIALSNWLLTAFHFFYSGLFYWGSVKYRFVFACTFFYYINKDCNIQGVFLLNKRNKPQMLVNILMFGLCESFVFIWKKNSIFFSCFVKMSGLRHANLCNKARNTECKPCKQPSSVQKQYRCT